MAASLIRRERSVTLRQGNTRVGDAEVLGQVLTPRGLNAANTLAGANQMLEGAPFDRVQLAQVHDRFRQVDRRGRGGQKVPAEDLTAADLVPDGARLEDVLRDQLRS